MSTTPKAGKCSSCHKPVLWITTAAGKAMPLDPTPERRVVLVPDPIEMVDNETHTVSGGGPDGHKVGVVMPTYVSHFATCPNAAQHRKPTPPRLPGMVPEWRGAMNKGGPNRAGKT
jgi:hypothetical protein